MRIVSCTRAEAEVLLVDLAIGWEHSVCEHREERRAEAQRAYLRLCNGHTEVTAGHTTYRIEEA